MVLSTHDDSVVGEALRPSSDVIEAAVAGAVEAFPRLKGMTTRERAEILMRASTLIHDRGSELARLIAIEAGKPWRYAAGEAARAVHTF